MGAIYQMPQTSILFIKNFDVWGIDFMESFPSSYSYIYILISVNYVYKWLKFKATITNNSKVVEDFVKSSIFARFGILKPIIGNDGL